MILPGIVPVSQDAYGQMIFDYWQGNHDIVEIIEREDGYVDTTSGPLLYFAPYAVWSAMEQEAIGLARGRVLDIGCGAGRHAIYLQEQGHHVTGVDNSPLAVEVSRRRGLQQVVLGPITQVSSRLGEFDTVTMMGNNFGLFGSRQRARWLLRRWKRMIRPGGRIIAQTLDPYTTDNEVHRAYHEWNRSRGRMGGQVRIRMRYKDIKGLWFDYLFVSQGEMGEIVTGTGWQVERILQQDNPSYMAIIVRD